MSGKLLLRQRQRQIRALLNEWDPAGLIGHGGREDEYDCLLWPLLARLHSNAPVAQVALQLSEELRVNFSLASPPDATLGFAERAKACFDAAGDPAA